MKNLIIIFFQTFFIIAYSLSENDSNFDDKQQNKDDPNLLFNFENNFKQYYKLNRQLVSQQMRITFDTTYFQQISMNATLISQLNQLLNTVSQFYNDLILLKEPITNKLLIPSSSTSCNSQYSYTESQKQNGFSNTDLQIFVDLTLNSTFVVDFNTKSTICEKDTNNNRVIFGLLRFTFLNFNLLQKQVIHEVMHLLAMDVTLVSYFKDTNNQYYSSSIFDPSNQTLTYPQTLQWAQNYFNCPVLNYIPIEILNGALHWNRVFLLDDIMSGLYTQGEAVWSGINNSFLKDTGWYDVKDTMADSYIKWGKNKGCQFIDEGCNSPDNNLEFCQTLKNLDISFTHNGLSQCTQFYTQTDSKSKAPIKYKDCNYKAPVQNRNCWNPENQNSILNSDAVLYLKYNFGYNSRAFKSSLTPLSLAEYASYGCYETKCSNDQLNITISFGSYKFVCSNKNEFIYPSKSFEYSGNIQCPSDIQDFCTSIRPCQNFCSSKGYCLNGTCQCLPGYGGQGCECLSGLQLRNGLCRTCSSLCKECSTIDTTKCESCDDGYYLQNGECKICQSACLTCSDSQPAQCLSCAQGQYLDTIKKLCVNCSDNCKQCNDSSSCVACNEGYGLSSTNLCITCVYDCQQCQLSPLYCIQCYSPKQLNTTNHSCYCPSSQYEDPSGNCLSCKSNCAQCTTKNDCSECSQGYILRPKSQTCVEIESSQKQHLQFIIFLLLIYIAF